jgi:hypothetical protein
MRAVDRHHLLTQVSGFLLLDYTVKQRQRFHRHLTPFVRFEQAPAGIRQSPVIAGMHDKERLPFLYLVAHLVQDLDPHCIIDRVTLLLSPGA